MNITKFFLCLITTSCLFLVSAKASLVEDNNIPSEKDARGLTRNQSILYGDKFKLANVGFAGLLVGEFIGSNINQNTGSRFADKTSYSTFCVPKIMLYVTSNLNEWATANIGLNFAPSPGSCSACGYGGKNDPSRFNKYDKVDEAHVVFANSSMTPYFAKIGIQYFNYGDYSPHAIPASFTQMLTQVQAPGVTLGYRPGEEGLNFSIFSFTDKVKREATSKINNLGAQIGYVNQDDFGKTEISLDFLKNIASSVNYIVSSNQCSAVINPLNSSYKKEVAGLSLTLKKQINDFLATIGFTSAISKFDKGDVAWKEKGARPAALLLDLNYKFTAFDIKQNLAGINYQRSAQGVNIKGNNLGRGLPEHRVQAYYSVEVMKNIDLGAQVIWDKDYGRKNKGSGKSSVTSLITLMAKLM